MPHSSEVPPMIRMDYQPELWPSDAIMAQLTIGRVHSCDHWQFQVEVTEPDSNHLVGMWSWPHVHTQHVQAVLDEIVAQFMVLLSSPFDD